jgi:hypothetical protein
MQKENGMLKEALEFLLELKRPAVVKDKEGREYSTLPIHAVKAPQPQGLSVRTLTALVDYFDHNPDKLALDGYIVLITSPTEVHVLSPVYGDFKQRDTVISAVAAPPEFDFDTWLEPSEQFNPKVQACFVDNPGKQAILKLSGNITERAETNTLDDGITQTVTAKAGIARVGEVEVPNPVMLAPFRTFPEIEQPESAFVFRMRGGPYCKLVEADGGAWKNMAIDLIAEFLAANLPEGTMILS